jgi:hypothetical protein
MPNVLQVFTGKLTAALEEIPVSDRGKEAIAAAFASLTHAEKTLVASELAVCHEAIGRFLDSLPPGFRP